LIIRGGHNIDPKMIEDALGAHPAVQICAAVGAPDAYAGELPVLFATLVPGSTVTEAELLAFAAQRVDEGPAKPKTVTIVETMPMTNVGKLYKPALRLLAAQAVVAALIDELCREFAVDADARPQLQASEHDGVQVRLALDAGGARAAELHERLRAALAALPVKTTLASS
jgi:fatty-acyl-CoA synthase